MGMIWRCICGCGRTVQYSGSRLWVGVLSALILLVSFSRGGVAVGLVLCFPGVSSLPACFCMAGGLFSTTQLGHTD